MTNAPTIRRARKADAEPLGLLWRRLLDEQAALDARLATAEDALARWHNDFPLWLNDETQRLFVAERTGAAEVVGFVTAARWAPPPIYESAAEVYVSELYVAPEARRQGVGAALVEAVRRWAEEVGAERLRLRVLAANADGRSFWKRLDAAPFALTLMMEMPRRETPAEKTEDPEKRFGF